jgi:type IV pilus assembly protein PilM
MLKGKFEFDPEVFSKLLKPKSPPLIGVDISSSSVKMVELGGSRNACRLDRYTMGTRVKNLALALPSAAVITKKIVVPAGQTEDELETQVETEANQYIPFALEEVNLDFQTLGPAPNSPDDVEVLIAASRKEKVEDRVAVAESVGLKAIVMDIDAFAAQNAFELMATQLPEGGVDQTIALVDIGASLMNINVLRNNQSVYVREQPFGGMQLTQEIMRAYNLSAEEAEAAKRNGGLPDSYESDVLAPFMDTLALEVVRALQFFFTSTQFNQVHHVFLSGGCASIPGLAQVVAERTQVNTLVANPFIGMDIGSKIRQQQLAVDASALVVACGLALRRFDE